MSRKELLFIFATFFMWVLAYFSMDIYFPALPLLVQTFNTNVATIQSTISLYLLGAVVAQFFGGPISEHFGFKQTAIPCCLLFVIGSIICSMAPSVWVLNLGRIIQALGAGILAVVGRASLPRYFDVNTATKLYLIMGPLNAASPALGPILGGYLTHHFSWRAVFIFLIGFGLFMALMIKLFYLLNKEADVETSLKPSYILGKYWQIISHRIMLSYLLVVVTGFMVFNSYMAEMPFILHNLGYGPKQIGYTYFPVVLAFVVFSQVVRPLIGKISNRMLINIGFVMMALGFAIMWFVTTFGIHAAYQLYLPMALSCGAIAFLTPIAISQGIGLFRQNAGFASATLGGTNLFASAAGAQTIDWITNADPMSMAKYLLTVTIFGAVIFNWLHRYRAEAQLT